MFDIADDLKEKRYSTIYNAAKCMKTHGLGNALFYIDMDILLNVVLILRQLCFIFFSSYFFLFFIFFISHSFFLRKYNSC